MNMEFKGKCHTCRNYEHTQNKRPKRSKPEEGKQNKKFSGTQNYCSKRPKNWKKKEDKEAGASNIEVLLGCVKTSVIKYEADEVLFEIDLWELALQKLDKIPLPSNPPDDSENNMGSINIEEIKEDGLAAKKGLSGAKCCSSKIQKIAVPVRVALLQIASIWVGDLGAYVH